MSDPSAQPQSGTAPSSNPQFAGELLPALYEELRRLARLSLARERVGHPLGPTALVHEAYLRIEADRKNGWASRGQFFVAAAEAMRRILIEEARKGRSARHGGGRQRITLSGIDLAAPDTLDQVLVIDEALQRLERADPRAAEVVRLRFYAGLSESETAEALGLSDRTVRREWSYARAWLFDALESSR